MKTLAILDTETGGLSPDAISPGNAKDLEAQLRGVVETPVAPDSKPKDKDGEPFDPTTGEVQPTREPGEEG